jgi:hypothetical protein
VRASEPKRHEEFERDVAALTDTSASASDSIDLAIEVAQLLSQTTTVVNLTEGFCRQKHLNRNADSKIGPGGTKTPGKRPKT